MSLVKISQAGGGGSGSGTVTSVGLTSATSGVTIGGTPVTTSGNITLAIATATGGQNGLLSTSDFATFSGKQNNIGLTTVGTALATLPNPSAVRYLRVLANNSVEVLTASQVRADLGFITQTQANNVTNSSSTVPVNITGVSVTLEPNASYIGKLTIASISVPANGFFLTLTFPAGAVVQIGRLNTGGSVNAQVMLFQTAASASQVGQFGQAVGNGYAELQLSIVNGNTGGTITPSFTSGTNGSLVTIVAGLTSVALQKI